MLVYPSQEPWIKLQSYLCILEGEVMLWGISLHLHVWVQISKLFLELNDIHTLANDDYKSIINEAVVE